MLCALAANGDADRVLLIDPSSVRLVTPYGRRADLTLDNGVKVSIEATLEEVEHALTAPNAEWIGNGDTGFVIQQWLAFAGLFGQDATS